MPTLTIHHVPSPTPDAALLVSELDAILHADSPPENRHGLPLSRIFQPHIRFFLAYLDSQPVGCGGVAFFDTFAEVKRMYVRPAARGQGVATALLSRLESDAASRGIPRLTLETGDNRDAAIALYKRHGFTPCPPFGDYLSMPPTAIAHSVFLHKPLLVNQVSSTPS